MISRQVPSIYGDNGICIHSFQTKCLLINLYLHCHVLNLTLMGTDLVLMTEKLCLIKTCAFAFIANLKWHNPCESLMDSISGVYL